MPRVSVIVPTYNRREWLCEAIDSILAQTYGDLEVIVIDDGSTDGTGGALRERYGDRIRYRWYGNAGVSAARNRGIELARGEFVAFLDSDDLWLEPKVEKQVHYLDEHPEVGAVFCQGWWMDEAGHSDENGVAIAADVTPEDLTLVALLGRGTLVIAGSTLMARRDLLQQLGGFDEELQFGEDWDICIRLRAAAPIAQVPEPLCRIRVHLGNVCRLRPWENVEPTLRDHLRLLKKGAGLVPAREPYLTVHRQAEAREYAEAGLLAMAWGRYDVGGTWMGEAARRDPIAWREASRLGLYLVNYIVEVEQRSSALQPGQWGALMRATMDALPRDEYSHSTRRSFYRWMVSYLFFQAAEKNDYAMLRWGYPRLLCSDLRAAIGPDVLSKAVESLVGETGRGLARGLKRLVRGATA